MGGPVPKNMGKKRSEMGDVPVIHLVYKLIRVKVHSDEVGGEWFGWLITGLENWDTEVSGGST